MRSARPFLSLLVFSIVLLIWPGRLVLAKSGETDGKAFGAGVDLLVRQVDDLNRQSDRILQDQEEILKTIENLKIWTHRQ